MNRWWIKLGRYALPHARGLATLLGIMLIGIALEALRPWPLKYIIDNVLAGQSMPEWLSWLARVPGGASSAGQLGFLAAGTVLIFIAHKCTAVLHAYAQAGLSNRMVYDLSGALFDRLQRLSLRFHNTRRTGDIVRRVTTDCTCMRELIIGVFLPILHALVSLAIMFTIMWKLDPALSLLALSVAPLLLVLIKIFERPMTERTYQHQEREGDLMALAEQTLTALPAVQAFGREKSEDEKFTNRAGHALQAYARAVASQMHFKIGVGAATALGTAGVMFLGGLHVMDNALTLGELLVFLAYLASLYTPLETLAYTSSGFASAAARAHRVLEVLEAEDSVKDPAHPTLLPAQPKGHIRFENTSFGYMPGIPVLQDITLDISPGQTLAIVGPTGAGKTTLVSLIPRFFDPDKGRICFDGIDLRHLSLSDLRHHIGMVLQDPFLLPLTVAENIAYGRPGASRQQIVAAAEAACAHDFIQRLPQGYDTPVAERGAAFSGGQKQRIAIARALLKDAPILILDEPTASLDAATEHQVVEAIRRLCENRTAIVIAHRMSTVRHADAIAVLHQGAIAEQGTHDQLCASGGIYAGFYQRQFGQMAS